MIALTSARLSPSDVLRVGLAGLRARPLRVALSSLGIAIGIATMVAVVGISSSSQADLLRQLDRLGTNLLTVAPGTTVFGEDAKLPPESVSMVRSIGPVESVAATADLDASVYRSDKVPPEATGGVAVSATTLELFDTLRAELRTGTWLNAATEQYPAAVLGSVAAKRLGVTRTGTPIWLGNRWFIVVGILEPLPIAPDVERAALVGWDAAQDLLGFDGHPTMIYERSSDAAVEDVRAVLGPTVSPEHPEQVQVSRPSDALAARAAAAGAFTSLLLGLGAVALFVGGVGVANTMIISVLERRREIGLRRSLGATRRHIRLQFLTESLLLALAGGATGTLLGSAVTAAYAAMRDLPPSLPPWAPAGGVGAAIVIGTLAGIYPAVRAARLSPTVALAAP